MNNFTTECSTDPLQSHRPTQEQGRDQQKAKKRYCIDSQGTSRNSLECFKGDTGTQQIPPCDLEYTGNSSETLDALITEEETYAAVRAACKNTAVGADTITNTMIQNLGGGQIKALTDYANNKLWEAGKVPEGWRHAGIITIPKPRKKTSLETL